MTEREEKEAFAIQWLKYPDDAFKAALNVFPTNTNRALRAANEWPLDPEVIAIKTEVLNKVDEDEFLPSKATLKRELWRRMSNPKLTADEYSKLAKLYADVSGFIEKPGTTINNNVANISQRVIEIPVYQSQEEWERHAQSQQNELLNVSRSRH